MKTYLDRMILVCLICGALAVGHFARGHAATLTFPVSAYSAISDKAGRSAILVDFGALDTLKGKRILYAKCYLNITADSCLDSLNEFELKPLVKEWSTVTSGSADLSNSGSAVSTAAHSVTVDLPRGPNGDTEFLLTDLLQAWVNERLPNRGVILLPRLAGCTYRLIPKNNYPALGYGKLLVRFSERSH